MQAESKSPCGLSIQSLLRLTKRMSTGKCTYTSSVRRLSCSITDANLFLKHSYNTFKTSMVHSRKVLRPQNLFSRKPQRYKRRMSRCVDARHLCLWNQHVLCLVLPLKPARTMSSIGKITIFCNDANKTSTSNYWQ